MTNKNAFERATVASSVVATRSEQGLLGGIYSSAERPFPDLFTSSE